MNRMSIRLTAGLALMLVATGAFAAQLPDFTQIVKKNVPAVVHVKAEYNGSHERFIYHGNNSRSPQQLPPGVPDIIRRLFGQQGQMPPQERAHVSVGSGFIISSDGYILTNDHVVDHADKITVRLRDRRVFTATVVGTDKPYDIALLKIDAKNLPTVTLGDSSTLEPGEWVLAIGMPFDFDYTVTQGIVSATGRTFGSQDQEDVAFIQTDVPINRGNSGGPLFNLDGQVVGINSQIYSSTGGYMGVSFSIPINTAMDAVRQLKSKGYVSRGMIGVTIQQVTANKATALKLPAASGALIRDVTAGGPGAKAGLQRGDVILAFNGTPIMNASALPPMVAGTLPGTDVTLKVFHKGKTEDVRLKLGALPRDEDSYSSIAPTEETAASSNLGFTVQDINAAQREALKIKSGQGVVVSNVQGRQAMRAGLQPGDVILMVGQHEVGDVKEFQNLTKQVKPGDTLMFLVRDGQGNSGFITETVPSRR